MATEEELRQFHDTFKQKVFEWLNIESVKPAEFSEDEAFFGGRLGLDSLDAVELVVLLQRNYGVPQKAFEGHKEVFKTLKALTEFVRTYPERGAKS